MVMNNPGVPSNQFQQQNFNPAPIGQNYNPTQQSRLAIKGVLAQIGVGIVSLVSIFRAIASFRRARIIDDPGRMLALSFDEVDSYDNMVIFSFVAFLLCFIFAMIVFIVWFYSAYKNLASFGARNMGAGWAIGSWFIPFASYVMPILIGKELWDKSQPQAQQNPTVPFMWWFFWVASSFVNILAFFVVDVNDLSSTPDYMICVSALLLVVSGVFGILFVQKITKMQDARLSSQFGGHNPQQFNQQYPNQQMQQQPQFVQQQYPDQQQIGQQQYPQNQQMHPQYPQSQPPQNQTVVQPQNQTNNQQGFYPPDQPN